MENGKLEKKSGWGKLEILRPNLDWPRIWKETAALPTNIRETMFLFNQRRLPTRTRCHRLDPTKDATCLICNQDPETDEHLMYQCPERLTVWSWLEGTMRQMGCSSSNEDLIRGHFGPVGNLQLSFTLLAAYLYINWKARNNLRTPCQEENLYYSTVHLETNQLLQRLTVSGKNLDSLLNTAPSEVRTHDLEIMRLARCLLRYRGMYSILHKKEAPPQ
ncbi:hypothetical protein OUZ56_024502 [Daphnia magna]|uniref:Reverse transcriptase zinc-binding domain-containing protein n=1 Tax=Daphnia magna TaxID=35525 RepID=A0ABR0B114_9CRUS|nr:hypothetical protein OUZ56_024502 [Daphnia magna]